MHRLLFSMIMVAALLPCPMLFGHAFHISTAELEFNPTSQRFEVGLKLHAADLERALSEQANKRISIDNPELGKLAQEYLGNHFYLMPLAVAQSVDRQPVTKDTPRSTVKFVGKEVEETWIWLYFELEPPKTKEKLAIVNTVLLTLIDDQINTVEVRHGKERTAIKMTKKKPWDPFLSQWYVGR